MEPDFVIGNVFDKYRSGNLVYRKLLRGYFNQLEGLVRLARPRQILEVGCGEGYVCNWLGATTGSGNVCGLDLSPEMLGEAYRKYPAARFVAGSAYSLPFDDSSFDLVLCLEVLEHLRRPEDALREARRVSNGYLIASVPREPIWRLLNLARGAYWRRLGNTPGHVQHWNRRTVAVLLSKHWRVHRVVSPFPWTMAFCAAD